MRVLAVFAHPRRDSFTGAMLDRFTAGLEEAGCEVEVADLYRERFDAYLRPEDYAQFSGDPMPAAVRREQARVEAASALAFVFPLWWWSFPAMLKGWIDRVFSEGWAYHFTLARARGLLADRPTILLCSCGSSARTFRRRGTEAAIAREIDEGVLAYCGLNQVERHMFHEVDDDDAARRRYLETARELGRRFGAAVEKESKAR